MDDESQIHVPYREGLKPLEDLLKGVRRPGDFFVQGGLDVPMPRVEVEGVGVLSFPVPDVQIAALMQKAERAPYGRGEETILDTSVRNVWQVPASRVQVGGKTWENTFDRLRTLVCAGLGCEGLPVAAELYKLLVYDPGAFFKAHRDTEKAPGMFGTLVVVLPSAHRGGELMIRHAGREVTVDLSGAEVSELKFAAFYADCEHEVRPVTEGHRVCLVYNLLQEPDDKRGGAALHAPLYEAEVAAATNLLHQAFSTPDAPVKIAWLLAHQYSPAELAFANLKHADAALAKVLRQVAARAGCVVHLGILHIEESGPAQPEYDAYASRRGSHRGRYSYDDDEEVEEDVSSDDFEVIEVSDASCYVDQWKTNDDRSMDYGRIPLTDGEVLPAGALDDEAPDEQRLTEATGNEGASFERSYHRAVLVIWPRERFADVLLQAGVGAALPWFRGEVAAALGPDVSETKRAAVHGVARRIMQLWAAGPDHRYDLPTRPPDRSEMIVLLGRIGDPALLGEFIATVVIPDFDGSETGALAEQTPLLDAAAAGALLARLVATNLRWFPVACVDLLARLVARHHGAAPVAEWTSALRAIAAALVEDLRCIEPAGQARVTINWNRSQKVQAVDASVVAGLLATLADLGTRDLRDAVVAAMCAATGIFVPDTVVVPALTAAYEKDPRVASGDAAWQELWSHAATFLLDRSEFPPAPPQDWRQDVTIACTCVDCRGLQNFARDPAMREHRFRVRMDRRQHLHQAITHLGLDMTHVTDRKGSPQTLVCTKTRETYARLCRRHRDDLAALKRLAALVTTETGPFAELTRRITAAHDRGSTQGGDLPA